MSVSSIGENEINYYDLNDPFIDDDEVVSDNSQNEFFSLTLAYGNYTEDEVLKNLMKTEKQRSAKKKKPNSIVVKSQVNTFNHFTTFEI